MRRLLFLCLLLTCLFATAAEAAPRNGRILLGTLDKLLSMNPDGSDPRAVSDAWGASEVSGSPDGKTLVVADDRALVLLSASDGSEVGRIERPDEFYLGHAEWSPRGGEIAYQECDKSVFTDIEECVDYGIYRVPVGGGERKRVAEGTGASWSSDGRRLAFMHRVRRANSEGNECDGIHVARRDGSGLRRVYPRAKRCLPAPFSDTAPIFGARDRTILFPVADKLYSVRLGGRGLRRVLSASRRRSIVSVRLSPDGKRIAYVADGRLWVTSAARGGRGKPVTRVRYPNALDWLAAR